MDKMLVMGESWGGKGLVVMVQTRDERDDEGDERGVGEQQEGGEVERLPVGRPHRPRGGSLLLPRHGCPSALGR